jgi:hypothetical protein
MERYFAGVGPALLLLYLSAAYVAYIASGALPSSLAPGRRKSSRVLVDRALFFAAFALLPYVAYRAFFGAIPGENVLVWASPLAWLPLTAALTAAAYLIGLFSRKGEAERASYPQYLPTRWGARELVLEVGSWSLYLFAYELAFRGFVLFALKPLGPAAAIAASTGLYAFAHLPKSSKEAALAIPFGVVASLLTLEYGTILPAFLVHLALALGNDQGCARASATRGGRAEPSRRSVP